MILELSQVAEAVKDKFPQSAIDVSLFGTVMAAFKLWDRRTGQHRDIRLTTSMKELKADISEIKTDVQKINWHIVGPTGTSGLLKDVADIVQDIDNLRSDVDQLRRHIPPDDIEPPNHHRRR